MTFRSTFPVVVLTAALLYVSTSEVSAQVEVSGTGSVVDIRGGTFGLGGRLGVPIRRNLQSTLRIEAGFDYYFPDCGVECDVAGGHLDLIFQSRLGGRALLFYGLGGSFENVNITDDEGTIADGDFWGFNLVAGGRYNQESTIHPFLEIRWTGLEEIDNQFALTLGMTAVLGG